jgi:predicted dehydrogenase
MKQVLQSLRNGQTYLEEVPCPALRRNAVLIQSQASLISAGTERMLVEFGKAGLLGKAKAQPEKVQQVLDKIRTDGLLPTLEAVFRQLDEPLPLGYCNAGRVLAVGPGVTAFQPGDRVASNGPHAEIVSVPQTLCAKLPDAVSYEQASFSALGSIGLQGIRLLQPTLGEKVVVYGLGLIGLLTVQLARASGCEVLGVDVNAQRLELARQYGAQTVNPADGADAVAAAQAWSGGRGVDGVLITASASGDSIVHQAAEMCRKRGRIVLVGVVDLELRRNDFYEKELSFQVSCSYGPGRYDPNYETAGQDYPLGFVRWTEQRNFEAVIDMLASGRLDVSQLISHRYRFAQAEDAYAKLQDKGSLGVVLQYDATVEQSRRVTAAVPTAAAAGDDPKIGVIGSGTFAKMTLLPGLSKCAASIHYVANRGGVAGKHLANRHGATHVVSDYRMLLEDPAVDAVFIAVGHHLHAPLICEALEANKHVFVEKPLAIDNRQLESVLEAADHHPDRQLMVGFNRRFSPHTVKIQQLLRGRSQPLAMNMTVNAGAIPAGHWVHDPQQGGGRIIGEACHFVDLMVHLTGAPVRTVSATMMAETEAAKQDKMSLSMTFGDGSIGTVHYFANGAKTYPKEQLEIFSEGRVLRLDNFRCTRGFGFPRFRKFKTWRQDKGHVAEFSAFLDRIRQGGQPLIPLPQSVNVTRTCLAAMAAAETQQTLRVEPSDNAVEPADQISPAATAA